MNRKQLEHIVRASGSISGSREIVACRAGMTSLIEEPSDRKRTLFGQVAGLARVVEAFVAPHAQARRA